MAKLVFLNKPFGVLTQFTDEAGRQTLKDYLDLSGVYPAGRLDHDSEGLVVLTDHGPWQTRIADPRHKLPKTYWVQVERIPDEAALARLRAGLDLGDFVTAPCEARLMAEPPGLWLRHPPIRHRESVPTAWLEIRIREGKNRQVRRMTAKIGFPTLRLIRRAVGPWTLDGLAPGEWRFADAEEIAAISRQPAPPPRVNRTDGRPRSQFKGGRHRQASSSKPIIKRKENT